MKWVTREVSTTHKTLGEIKISVEVPQVESLEEFTSFVGGSDKHLVFVNKAVEDDARASARVAIKAIPDGANLDEATLRIQGIAKNYTPEAADGRAVRAKKVAAMDEILAAESKLRSGDISVEDLLAMLAKAR